MKVTLLKFMTLDCDGEAVVVEGVKIRSCLISMTALPSLDNDDDPTIVTVNQLWDWHVGMCEPIVPPFNQRSGPQVDMPDDAQPLDYLQLFLTTETIKNESTDQHNNTRNCKIKWKNKHLIFLFFTFPGI